MQKIVRRKSVFSWQSEASDLVQGIALRLLNWRNRNLEKSKKMSLDEWQSFAAKTAYNEINRQFADNSLKNVALETAPETASDKSFVGQSETEVLSLALEVWQETCNLSLRQRRALFFGSQELVIYFLRIGITDEELAASLSLTMDEWVSVKEKLPLRDVQIAKILKEKGNQKNIEAIAKSIKKARHEARLKVRRAVEK
ncbi:MAG: hypothetical protein WA584_02180 [Pyrinomonadaceae bacterium]